jgi:hypothetical protein
MAPVKRAAHPRPFRQGGGGDHSGVLWATTPAQPVGMRGVASQARFKRHDLASRFHVLAGVCGV